MLICETPDEYEAVQGINTLGRRLVNLVLFDTEDAPMEALTLAASLYMAFERFEKAQEDAKLVRELADRPPEGRA